MPADTTHQGTDVTAKKTDAVPILVVSLLTLVFASFSMITGSRLSTLQTQFKDSMNQTAISDADSRKRVQNELDSTRQAQIQEKKKNDQLKKKITAFTKEMAALRSELDSSKKMIEHLQSSEKAVPRPIVQSPFPEQGDGLSSTSAKDEN